MNLELIQLRQQIDQIDHQLLKLLHQRQQVVKQISKLKQHQYLPSRDLIREQQILTTLKQISVQQQFDLTDEDVEVVFRAIMQRGLALQV